MDYFLLGADFFTLNFFEGSTLRAPLESLNNLIISILFLIWDPACMGIIV